MRGRDILCILACRAEGPADLTFPRDIAARKQYMKIHSRRSHAGARTAKSGEKDLAWIPALIGGSCFYYFWAN
jgi:hypothetical protein